MNLKSLFLTTLFISLFTGDCNGAGKLETLSNFLRKKTAPDTTVQLSNLDELGDGNDSNATDNKEGHQIQSEKYAVQGNSVEEQANSNYEVSGKPLVVQANLEELKARVKGKTFSKAYPESLVEISILDNRLNRERKTNEDYAALLNSTEGNDDVVLTEKQKVAVIEFEKQLAKAYYKDRFIDDPNDYVKQVYRNVQGINGPFEVAELQNKSWLETTFLNKRVQSKEDKSKENTNKLVEEAKGIGIDPKVIIKAQAQIAQDIEKLAKGTKSFGIIRRDAEDNQVPISVKAKGTNASFNRQAADILIQQKNTLLHEFRTKK